MIKLFGIFIFIISSLSAEDFQVNYSYQKAKIKVRAKQNNNRNSRNTCYIYVDINGNKDWRKYKHELNTNIRNTKSKCKKYMIYKVINNVKANFYRTNASNNLNTEYKINLGAIVEENADVDIQIYTIVKNSKLNSGMFEQKVNTGIVNKSSDIDGVNYNVNSSIDNSTVGQQNYFSEKGLNMAKEFMDKDEDSPFN